MRLTRRRALGLAAAGGLLGVLPGAAYSQQSGAPGSGSPGQSNLVPGGEPTPTTAFEQLAVGGPPRDPGTLAWAQPGPYLPTPGAGVTVNSFGGSQRLATTTTSTGTT